MECIYRNNAGRFRLETGVQTFLPPTVPAPGLNESVDVPSSSPSVSLTSTCPQQWFFGATANDQGEFLLKNSGFQESCPSIHFLSGSDNRNAATTLASFKKPQSSSAPNEGITGSELAFYPPTRVLGILKKRNTNKRPPSLSGGGPLHLENPERETRWYFKYFLGKGYYLHPINLCLAVVRNFIHVWLI